MLRATQLRRLARWAMTLACSTPLGTAAAQSGRGAVDSVVADADRAALAGRPWLATRLLAQLSAEAEALPTVRLAKARAAIGWEGWDEASRLLAGATWLDQVADGEGHRLLTRAAVERGQAAQAIAHASSSPEPADTERLGEWLVTLARALELDHRDDPAAAGYLRAAAALPSIGDWLRLRAARLTADSAQRAGIYRQIESEVVRPTIDLTEARALERLGLTEEAARRYQAAGKPLAAIRLRLGRPDPVARRLARRRLAQIIATPLSADESEEALVIYAGLIADPTGLEALRLARLAGRRNHAAQAVAWYQQAGSSRRSDEDRLNYANLLAQLGRFSEAEAAYRAVGPGPLRGDAAYFRARAILRSGRADEAQTELRRIPGRFPKDPEPSARALYLLGDLAIDRGSEDSARRIFGSAFRDYPGTAFGRRAGFQAAFIAFVQGDLATAAAEFDRLTARSNAQESSASLYWGGEARSRQGDTAAARARWERLLSRDGDSYYAVLAARALGKELRPFGFSAGELPDISVDALDRAKLLERLGLRTEAEREISGFLERAGRDPDRLLASARALAADGYPGRSVRTAQTAQLRGASSNRALGEMLFPVPFRELLTDRAAARSLDPLLVASLIRQESAFDSRARSTADARGLMQVLPSVGESYARVAGVERYDPVLLYQPEVNLDFGIVHLADALDQFGSPAMALAAYNAGVDRVEQWRSKPGADDPEIFVERIPFTETRDYVRNVLRNYAFYRLLYPPTAP